MTSKVDFQGKGWLVALIFVALLVVPIAGLAKGMEDAQEHARRIKLYDAAMVKSGLSAQQQQRVKAIREQAKPQADALKAQLEVKHKALYDYLNSTNAREDQAQKMEADISRQEEALSRLRVKTWFEIRQLMTPDQLKKFMVFRKQIHPPDLAGHRQCKYP